VESGKWKVKSAGYGIENKCQYRAEDLKLTNAGWSFAIDDLQIQSRLIGKHQIYSLLAAAAVGAELGVESEKIKAALENYQLPPGRGRIIEGIRDSIIVDDSYNSSPEAVKSGLAMVAEFRSKHRLVAILGRMNELGEKSEAAHAEIGQHAADKVDLLILVGEFAAKTADAAKQAGIEAYKVLCFETPENLMDDVRDLIQDNDLIYVKASQNGMRLERVVKKIMAHPETARENLVRQESFWGS